MPRRSISVFIVVFWLACISWLFVREVLPRLSTGEPPHFAVDRMDDSRKNRLPIHWTAIRTAGGEERKYIITTRVEWDKVSDTGAYRALLEPAKKQSGSGSYPLRRLLTSYRIDPEGLMVSFTAEVETIQLRVQHSGDFDGTVRGGDCEIHWEVTTLRGESNSGVADVEVSRVGAVLLPLHPLPRIRGLSPGRRWGLPLLNPLIASVVPGTAPKMVWVNAEVRSSPEMLEWHRRDVSCHVIDYEGEDYRGSVWVEAAEDARVLRIEFRLGDDEWTVTRNEILERTGRTLR